MQLLFDYNLILIVNDTIKLIIYDNDRQIKLKSHKNHKTIESMFGVRRGVRYNNSLLVYGDI